MSDIGAPPELAWLPVDKLDVDPAYQRTLDTKASQKLIQKIADNFRWISFQAILATPKGQGDDRRWLIIDGQHRVAAAKARGIPHVPAVVVAEATQQEQASAFVGANRDRIPMQAQQLFQARLVGGDREAATVKRLCDAAGIELYRYNIAARQFAAGKTAAAPALSRILRVYGEAVAAGAIQTVADCLRHQPGALRAQFFLAAGQYLNSGGSPEDLRAGLARLGIRKLEAMCERLPQNSAAAVVYEALKRAGNAARAVPPAIPPAPVASVGAQPAASPAMHFQDDPKARRDRGSLDKIGRPEPFGRSASGSSLA